MCDNFKTPQEEFDYLFKKLTGYRVDSEKAQKERDKNGWYLLPYGVFINTSNQSLLKQIYKLLGGTKEGKNFAKKGKNYKMDVSDKDYPHRYWVKRPE